MSGRFMSERIKYQRGSSRILAITGLSIIITNVSGCVNSPGFGVDESAPPFRASHAPSASEGKLHSVLWMQTSAEYRASCAQSYRLARQMLDLGLADGSWTASIEQKKAPGLAERPRAVVVDVDETVLSNLLYQGWLIEEEREYEKDTWNKWCDDVLATPLPGALKFAQYAKSKGVTVFYITGRKREVEAETRTNLQKWGFPLDSEVDTLLCAGEETRWGSNKEAHRRFVAEKYRIVLLIGDDLGDFVSGHRRSPSERLEIVNRYANHWGREWIVVPNPTYGSWEASLYDFDWDASAATKRNKKLAALRTWRPRKSLDPSKD